jgi:hypothetical protein
MVWEVLEIFEETGKPLSAATKVGELVSLYVRKQEVARGIIVEQPLSFLIQNPLPNEKPISLNVSTTKTRALIQIDTILAPNCVIPYHRQSLKNIQNGEGHSKLLLVYLHFELEVIKNWSQFQNLWSLEILEQSK